MTSSDMVDVKVDVKLSSSWLLDIVDKLRTLGVADYIGLPQLVVVGDQSSGKSSVLEAFTQLPFPRDSGLCTRFATHIAFRQSTSDDNVAVSIIPGPSCSEEKKVLYKQFKRDGLKSLDGKEFLEILVEVCNLMGVSGPKEGLESGKATFSSDTLRIELSGRDRENLSIIDIPGIFRTPTAGVTTKSDIQLVKNMVYSYIRNERTIILAVIPANVDIATQEILSMAEEVDPKGLRTLGVLTKPDLVDKGGEKAVMDLVQNRRNKLRLGYCVVRNRGQKDLATDNSERLRVELEFFNTEPWALLDKDRVGVSALKERLQELLVEITRREFPKVKAQIDRQLIACKQSFAILGADRESPDKQRRYLMEMAISFQKITDDALNANYSRHGVFDDIPALRLPTLVVDRSDNFSDAIRKKGHTVRFDLLGDDSDNDGSDNDDLSNDDSDEGRFAESTEDSKSKRRVSGTPESLYQHYPELLDFIHGGLDTVKAPQESIIKWIEHEYRGARGYGLDVMSPMILPGLWQQQSKNWEPITLAFAGDIIVYVHDFICQLLVHVCPDERTRTGLLGLMMEELILRYQKAINHVKFILRVELHGTLLTKNHYFNDTLQRKRTKRLQAAMEKIAKPMPSVWSQKDNCKADGKFVRLEDISNAIPMGNVEHAVQDIHSVLVAYYKVARKRFVDTVCSQGTDYHLLNGDDSPLKVFSPSFVSTLTDKQLIMIADEDQSSKRQRKSLLDEIKALQEGRDLLKGANFGN